MNKPTPERLSLKEVTAILVRHYGHHEGLFDLGLEVKFGVGLVGPTEAETYPGAIFGVGAMFLNPTEKKTPHTVDAAEINPAPNARARKKATK